MKKITLLTTTFLFLGARAMELEKEWLQTNSQEPITLLHTSAKNGEGSVVSSILKTVKGNPSIINAPDENGRTALHLAASHNHDIATYLLLKAGARIDVQDNMGNTPLISAAFFKHKEALSMLTFFAMCTHPEAINIKNKLGQTALHAALLSKISEVVPEDKCYEIVRVLLKAGAKPNIQDSKHMNTPLQEAVACGYSDIIALLAQYGADPQIPNKFGVAFENAVKLNNTESAQALFDAFPNNSWDEDYPQLLLVATSQQNIELVQFLLNSKFSPRTINKEDTNIFHIACSFYNPELLKLILNHAKPLTEKYLVLEEKNHRGRTPLMTVIRMTEGAPKKEGTQLTLDQAKELIILLKKSGADVTTTDNEGKTPVERVKSFKFTDTYWKEDAEAKKQELINILEN